MTPSAFPPSVGTIRFIAAVAAVNAALYHLPLFRFAATNLDLASLSGALTLSTLGVALLAATALALALVAVVSNRLLKPFCMTLAFGNALALYFVVTYGVVLDKTMMGNVQGTNAAEALELLHPALAAYALLLGAVPAVLVARVRLAPASRARLAATALATVAGTAAWAWLAAGTWLWFDHHAKQLGGLVLPWSYVVNALRHAGPRLWHAGPAIALPPVTSVDDDRAVVLLVIGEAARRRNFQLYGYPRETNPQLSRLDVVPLRNVTACSTYTTASLRCLLSPVDAASEFAVRYEPLPSYLQRHGVDVIWRTRNWGQPPLQVQTFERGRELRPGCSGAGCDYDEVLLAGLEARIRASARPKVLAVLHEMGSHGPAYHARYPPAFERFAPVCKSVELSACTDEALVNAYDNTILYADHVLAQAIALLKRLAPTPSVLIYVADHGESLGEYGLYLHGTPATIAPDVQKQVPLIVWMSPEFTRARGVEKAQLEAQAAHSQRDVFHSVMGALALRSDAYDPRFDVFSEAFTGP